MPRDMRLEWTVAIFLSFVLAASTSVPVLSQQNAPSQAAPEMVLQFGHAGTIAKLVVSPDGRQLLSIGFDHTVRIWDVPSNTLLRNMPEDTGESFRTAFFRQPDQPVVVGITKRDIRIRDLASGRTIVSWPASAGTDLPTFSDVAMSADHETIALRASVLGAPVAVYSTTTGASRGSLKLPEVEGGSCLSLSADGTLLAHTLLWSRHPLTTDVWDIKVGQKQFSVEDTNGQAQSSLSGCPVFTLDGQFLIIAGRDGAVRIRDARTGDLRRTFETTSKPADNGAINSCSRPCISAIAVSPDGQWLATGTDDGTISLRNLTTGQEVQRIRDLKGAIYAVAIGPEGKWVAYGGGDYDIKILDARTRQSRVLSTNPDLIQTVACSASAHSCAFGTLDKRIQLWNVTSEREKILSIHASQVNALSFSANGRWLVSGSGDKTIKIYDVLSGAISSLPGHTRAVTAVAFSPDGQEVASGSVGGDVKIWDRQSAKLLHTLLGTTPVKKNDLPNDRRVLLVHFNGNGSELTVAFDDGEVAVFDIATEKVRHLFRTGLPFKVSLVDTPASAVMSPDDRWMVTTHGGIFGGAITVWDAATGAKIRPLSQGSAVIQSAAFSPDGRWLATGSSDTTIYLWDTHTWKASTLRGHQGYVKSLSFGPDPHRLISGSGDGTVRIWDVPSGRLMAVIASQKGGQRSVVVSPTGLFDGTADAMQQVAWRIPNTLDVSPLDAFFTDFFHPGLFGELMAGGDPAPELDFAAVLQVPGLRTMLVQKQAHIETRNEQAVVCFAEPPRAAADVPVTEQRLLPRVVRGFRIDPQDQTCPYQHELPLIGSDSATLAKRLSNWKPERVSTPWDGKQSTDTAQSTLHVFVAGVGEYPSDSGFDRLPYAVTSARAIESFFREQSKSRSPYASVRIWDGLYDRGATRSALRERLTNMADTIRDNDVVLLYFAGHGVVSAGQEMFYFVPFDGQNTDLGRTSVSAAMLADGIRNIDARRVVLFLDACQSGSAVEPLSQIAAVKAKVAIRQAQVEPTAAGQARGVGIHVIAATLPLSYAVQITQEQSALAATTLAALRQQGQQLTIGQVSSYLNQHLADSSTRVAGFKQVPFIDSIGFDFPIARR